MLPQASYLISLLAIHDKDICYHQSHHPHVSAYQL